ncbi:MAG: hypothetical protein HYS33_07150 [Acidobacteria bacterium]|nr:hypothetical protein [Acidobacteriota bacterium]
MALPWFIAAICVLAAPRLAASTGGSTPEPASSAVPASVVPGGEPSQLNALGVTFVDGSTSQLILVRDGKKYLVDLASKQVRELVQAAPQSAEGSQPASAGPPSGQSVASAQRPAPAKDQKPEVYEAGDDYIFSLPTGRRLVRHGFYVNFNLRFAYNYAFEGKARGHTLLGLDDFSISSFGFRYGLTEKFSVTAYRSPSVIGRPIELGAAYNFLDERDGKPFNLAGRFSIEGQNDFSRNFTVNFEGIFSRSITPRAQIYVVPAISLRTRPVITIFRQIEDPPPEVPAPGMNCESPFPVPEIAALGVQSCANTFTLGIGGALDIRPTVALVAEVIPTLVNGGELGRHRPAYAFGIQKKIWRHAFTFGFSNSPGTTVSQRGGTRATLLGDPTADTPSGLFVGFDLTRQIY